MTKLACAPVLVCLIACGASPRAATAPPREADAETEVTDADADVEPEREPAVEREPVVEPEPAADTTPASVPSQTASNAYTLPSHLPPPPCDAPGLRADDLDLDGDGLTNNRKIFLPVAPTATGTDRLACSLFDFDQDGVFDQATIYDEAGSLYLKYMDFDFDGRVDAITAYDPHTGRALLTARDLDADGLTDSIEPVYPAQRTP
jgi:hypothetical protein